MRFSNHSSLAVALSSLARALAAIWIAVLDSLKREYAFNNLYTSITLDNSLYYVLIVYKRARKNSMFSLGSFTNHLLQILRMLVRFE